MKPKYSIGEQVKIKATGEKVKIESVNTTSNVRGTLYTVKEHYFSFFESELKPFRPSRTGKYRNKKGQFVSQYNAFEKLLKPVKVPDSKQRNYQKKPIKEVSGFTGGINIKDFTPYVDNEQKILTTLERIEKKIDELNNKGTVTYEQGLS